MAYNYFGGKVNDLSLRVENHALDLEARMPETHAPDNGVAVTRTGGEVVATR
jgi:hypothetical protein